MGFFIWLVFLKGTRGFVICVVYYVKQQKWCHPMVKGWNLIACYGFFLFFLFFFWKFKIMVFLDFLGVKRWKMLFAGIYILTDVAFSILLSVKNGRSMISKTSDLFVGMLVSKLNSRSLLNYLGIHLYPILLKTLVCAQDYFFHSLFHKDKYFIGVHACPCHIYNMRRSTYCSGNVI